VKVTVLYFSRLREAVGYGREPLDLPDGVDDVGALRAWLMARGDPWQRAFATTLCVRAAVDQTMAHDATALRDGAEVAFFPPVTGG
jgi:molybdopterin synthase sulfur carrier subunit